MLSAFLLFMDEELEKANLNATFGISIHDEIHYITSDNKKNTRAVAACMIRAHARTWALLQMKLGLYDLPLQRLYYDIQVDVSKALRKEPNQKVETQTFSYTEMGYSYIIDRKTNKIAKKCYE